MERSLAPRAYQGTPKAESAAEAVAKPGLGDMTGAIQMRHVKLWFAGKSHNWGLVEPTRLAKSRKVRRRGKFQPDFKGRPVAHITEEATPQTIKPSKKLSKPKFPPSS